MGDSLPRRRPIRLHYWDYSQPGYYFLTFCCSARACLFGNVIDGVMRLSEFGRIAEFELLRSVELRQELSLDHYIVMPNHIHLIAVISGRETLPMGNARATPA